MNDQVPKRSISGEEQRQAKVWLIQPVIAPYRIPLFREIGDTPGIDLTVVVQAETASGHPWKFKLDQLPFRTLLAPSKIWRKNFETDVHISPALIGAFLKHRPDVVICSGFTVSTMLLFAPMLLLRTPYIIWNEGTFVTESNASVVKKFVRRVLARHATSFLVAGTLSQQYLEGL